MVKPLVETEPMKPESPEPEAAVDPPMPTSRRLDSQYIGDDPAELRIWNRPIVVLRARMGGHEPYERAQQTVEAISSLPDELLGEEVWSEISRIRATDFALVGVTNQVLLALRAEDLDPARDQTLEELGAEVADRIQEVLAARAEQTHWPSVARNTGLALATTVLFILVLIGIFRSRALFQRRLQKPLERRKLHLSGFDLAPYLEDLTRGVAVLGSWLFILPLAYLWLAFVLSRFPFTRPWGQGLGDHLFDLVSGLVVGAISAAPGLFSVFLIYLVTRFLTRIVEAFFVSVETEALNVHWLQPETAKATRRLVIVVMWLFALTVAYPYIPGSTSAAFKGVSVFVGLMVSLGATGLVNQIVSGMVIVYTKAFRPGEFVRIGDTEGWVEDIGVLSTKILTLRREEVTIPNALLVGTSVNNYSRQAAKEGAVIIATVTIGYDAPWRQVHALLELAAERCPGIKEEPPPRVLQKALSDFYVEYSLLANIDDPADRYLISSALHGEIQDTFNEHGVQIMSPHYRDRAGQPVVIPEGDWSPPPAEPNGS